MMAGWRLWVLFACMVATALIVHARGDVDHVPPSTRLVEFPTHVDHLDSREEPISAEVLEVLGKGDFLNRRYLNASGTPPVDLFIGYFPTQRTGQSIHSPQNCLPGSGWTFESSGLTEVTDTAGKTHRVGEYVISNGVSRQEVLYWYRTQGRDIANDYAAKAQMLINSVLYDRTDAALVRVTTPLAQGESMQSAHARVVHFTQQIFPLLPAYIPN